MRSDRPAPVGDIAAFRRDRANVSQLVDRAEGRGLLQRHATKTDGHVKLVEISPDGHDVVHAR